MAFDSMEINSFFNFESNREDIFTNGGKYVRRSPSLTEMDGSFEELVEMMEIE